MLENIIRKYDKLLLCANFCICALRHLLVLDFSVKVVGSALAL